MIIVLRESSLSLARRAFDLLSIIYMLLGFIAIASVVFACFQAAGYTFWPTHVNFPTGLFFSPIAQGGFLGLVLVAMLRMGWWSPMPILAFGLYLNPNRGGWAIVGIGFLAHVVRQPLIILGVILGAAFYFSFHPASSDIERFNIWQAGLVNLTWFGNGWGSFSEVWIIREGLGFQPLHAHNDYLELAFELGLYSIPIFCILTYALTQTKSPEWPILIAFCFMATFAMPIYIPATAGIGALALASVLTKGTTNG